MLFEMRIYEAAPGRLPDLVERIGSAMPPFFDRHGFGERLGQWVVTTGADPRFAWLVAWPSFESRAAAFAGLGGDSDWNKLRIATNGPGEMVRRYDLRFLSSAAAGREASIEIQRSQKTLYEWRVHGVQVGRSAAAADALTTIDLPHLSRNGADLIGVFDNLSGPSVPGVSMLLGWSSYEARQEGLAAYELRPEVMARRAEERRLLAGEHALGSLETTLLKPTLYGTPDAEHIRTLLNQGSAEPGRRVASNADLIARRL